MKHLTQSQGHGMHSYKYVLSLSVFLVGLIDKIRPNFENILDVYSNSIHTELCSLCQSGLTEDK